MKKKSISFIMAIVMVVTIFTGCGSKKTKEDNTINETTKNEETKNDADVNNDTNIIKKLPTKLTFTYVTSPLNVPSIIDDEKDIIEDKFEKIGIDVDYAELTSGAEQTQALASGDVQILNAVGASSVILSAANGADIKVLSMYSRSPKAFCIYSKDKSIKSPKDLKGKKIAGPIGTNLHELLAAYLATEKMSMKDVNFVNMSIPDAKAALDSSRLDVALLAGTTAYEAEKQGYHKIADGEGLIDAIIVVAVTQDFYNKYPTVINKFKEAQEEIDRFIKENKEETMRIVADELDIKVEDVKEMYKYYDFSTEIKDSDKKGFQMTADFMYEAKMIEDKFDTNTLFINK